MSTVQKSVHTLPRLGARVCAQIAVLAAVLLALPASSGAALGPWSAPATNLSAPGAADVQTAVAPDGTITAVWQGSDGNHAIVQASTRAPGGNFSSPVDLAAAGQSSFDAQVAVAPDGTVTAVWLRNDGANYIVQASTRPPGGSFSAPVDLSVTGKDASEPQVAVGANGTTTAAWYRGSGSAVTVQVSTRDPGGSFGDAVDLSTAGQEAYSPDVAVAANGTTTVAWMLVTGGKLVVQASTRPPGGSFGAPVPLSQAGQNAQAPHLGIADDGTTTVAWNRFDGSNAIVQASTRPPGGNFGAPVDLSASGVSGQRDQMAVGADGTTVVVWVHQIGTEITGADYKVQASTRAPGGSFSPPVDLSAIVHVPQAPAVAVGDDGTATAVWDNLTGSTPVIQTSTRPPGGSFDAPQDLGTGYSGFPLSFPQVAIGSDGTSSIVWLGKDNLGTLAQAAFRLPQAGSPPVTPAPSTDPPAPPAGSPVTPSKSSTFKATSAFRLPSAGGCLKRPAKLTLKYLKPAGVTVEQVQVLIGAKSKVRLKGSKARTTIKLTKLPSKTFTLTVKVKVGGGKEASVKRTYRFCKR